MDPEFEALVEALSSRVRAKAWELGVELKPKALDTATALGYESVVKFLAEQK